MANTTDNDMAQALRELLKQMNKQRPRDSDVCYVTIKQLSEIEASLEAHESRAQAAKPDGYAYRYADGFLRFNQGAPVNGGKPIEAIPFYFAPPPAQQASVAAERPMQFRIDSLSAANGGMYLHAIGTYDFDQMLPYKVGAFVNVMLAAAPQPQAKGGV